MTSVRLEAFSDAVIAIAITIMVLEIKVPHGTDWGVLRSLLPVFLSYLMSFVYLGIYWNNHHHMLHTTERVNGRVLWANLHLLFWLSLIPFVTGWMGENNFAPLPAALYGVTLLMSSIAYSILQSTIIRLDGGSSSLRKAIGRDWKGKSSIALYAIAIGFAFVNHWIAVGIYVLVALLWIVPDKRIESIERTDET